MASRSNPSPTEDPQPDRTGVASTRQQLRWQARCVCTGLALMTLAGGALSLAGGTGPSAAAQADPTTTPLTLQFYTPVPAASTRAPATTPTPRPAATATPDDDEGTSVAFAADAWEDAYYQGNGEFYGRAWVAVYGAESEFPRATLAFDLDDAPQEDVVLTVDGLDDEWDPKNRIQLEVNGRAVYRGQSWFADWDGVGTGENAAWTTVRITIPAELLREGANEVAFVSREPVANFGSPPYILLAEATLVSRDVAIDAEDATEVPQDDRDADDTGDESDQTAEADETDDDDEATIQVTVVADDDGDDDDDESDDGDG